MSLCHFIPILKSLFCKLKKFFYCMFTSNSQVTVSAQPGVNSNIPKKLQVTP